MLELNLWYKIKRDTVFDGKVHEGTSREGRTERRVAWIALSTCGMEFGDDHEPLACSLSMDSGPQWKNIL
ncbi:MAG: hypothetical protein GY737_27870 [Desulfobacteraceae bacterium]|nr:hypothetical protein [Desulfobacteraceae bacterium]